MQALTTQRAATAHAEVRSSMGLVDTNLTKETQNLLWRARWKRTMVDVVVQDESSLYGNAPRLGELMRSACQQELEIKTDAVTPNDEAHNTNSCCILSLSTDGEALDMVHNSPVNKRMEV